jgi:predicted nucleic acid-binding protein
MKFDDLPNGAEVFIDANTFIYHFINHPKYGAAFTRLMERIELKDLLGRTSAHVLADVGHRLMTIEAINRMQWPATRLAARLKKHHAEIPKLTLYRQALTQVSLMGVQVLAVAEASVQTASSLSQQFELLTGDALIVAIMRQHGLTSLASEDSDFDRVAGIARYGPT